MQQQYILGTNMEYVSGGGMFSVLKPLIKATNGLTLSQVCAITGLEPSTIQNWVKRGYVAHPVNKKYFERQLARILLISALRDSMKIENIGLLMAMINGNANDESDDIITEEQLYDYFCAVITMVNESVPVEEEIDALLSEYQPPRDSDKETLKKALAVMVSAYTAAKYKQQAIKLFDELKESKNEKQ